MGNSKIIGLIYTLFVGVLIATFVGVGINTFYSEPKSPSYVTMYQTDSADAQTVKQQEYDKEYSVYTDKVNSYNRNVSIMTLIAAVILLHVSFYFEKRVKVLPDSIMLGGLFTLIYSVIRGFLSNDSKAVFIIVSIGLFTVIFIGYRRFVHVDKKLKKIKR